VAYVGAASWGYPSLTMDEMSPTTTRTRVADECLTLWLERDRVGAALHIAQLKQDSDKRTSRSRDCST
jgi:hypothetical protein